MDRHLRRQKDSRNDGRYPTERRYAGFRASTLCRFQRPAAGTSARTAADSSACFGGRTDGVQISGEQSQADACEVANAELTRSAAVERLVKFMNLTREQKVAALKANIHEMENAHYSGETETDRAQALYVRSVLERELKRLSK